MQESSIEILNFTSKFNEKMNVANMTPVPAILKSQSYFMA